MSRNDKTQCLKAATEELNQWQEDHCYIVCDPELDVVQEIAERHELSADEFAEYHNNNGVTSDNMIHNLVKEGLVPPSWEH